MKTNFKNNWPALAALGVLCASVANVFSILAVAWFLLVAAGTPALAQSTGDRRVPEPSGRVGVQTHYLAALAKLESGGNDLARGRAGEVGRFQCLEMVWREACPSYPLAAATNAATAVLVLRAVIFERTGKRFDEMPPRTFALAWHCPAKLTAGARLNREQRNYVRRFERLLAN